MEKLPPELLFKIMMFLPLEDRLSCSLTCRRLAEAMTSAQLLDDVWLDIAGHEMETATSVLVHTQRHYTKLSLFQADLRKFDSDFWGKVGANLRVLELQLCSWSNHTLYAILRQCTKLDSLKLVNISSEEISIDDFSQPEDACGEELRNSLSHLRHLHLDINTTAEIVDLLLALMPNVTSIFLTSWWHPESDILERLPAILKKNGIVRTGAHFIGANRQSMKFYRFVNFLEMTSESLEDFQIELLDLTESECDAIVECTRLRRLTIHDPYISFHVSHIRKLVSNSPDLEILELIYVEPLEDEDMMPLLELRKLHTLNLKGSYEPRIPTEFLRRLGDISSLVELVLDRLNIDNRVFQSLRRLTNLRSLTICNDVDSECFEAICENFKRLTELDLGNVRELTDADGIKLCRFKELRSLSFRRGYGFTDVTFERGVGSQTMKSLRIDGCSLTDAGLMSIASHHDRLEYMTLHDCKNVTDAGFLALLQKEPRLNK